MNFADFFTFSNIWFEEQFYQYLMILKSGIFEWVCYILSLFLIKKSSCAVL